MCALRSYDKSTKPIYVSVGHRTCLESAVRLVQSCCRYRIPEPIRQVRRQGQLGDGEPRLSWETWPVREGVTGTLSIRLLHLGLPPVSASPGSAALQTEVVRWYCDIF
uniref:Endonuclease V n=1 Tax=Chelonoidis abingdonii TaxID=106734 RepID=A0A8C0H9U8_CHEAB